MKNLHAFFSGMVQGVGFRFTTRDLARRHNIKGMVANLADGRVEIIAQASPKEIERFLTALRREFHQYITKVDFQEAASARKYDSFQIEFCRD